MCINAKNLNKSSKCTFIPFLFEFVPTYIKLGDFKDIIYQNSASKLTWPSKSFLKGQI
jgi:hypothetical protein